MKDVDRVPPARLFTGIATIGRLMQLNGDDYRWVIGMNRFRHAHLVLAVVLLGMWGRRSVRRFDPSLAPRFPSPKA